MRVVLEKYTGNLPVLSSAIAIANNSVYVTGSSNDEAVYWKDGIKTILPKRGYSATASVITFYQSDIYIGGMDNSTPVYWKNGVRMPLCCSQGGIVSGIAVVKR